MKPALFPQYQTSHPFQATALHCWPIQVLPICPRAWPSNRTDRCSKQGPSLGACPALHSPGDRRVWRISLPYVANKCLFFLLRCHLWRHCTYSVLGGGDGNLFHPLNKPKPTLFLHVYIDPNQKVQNVRSLERGWTVLICWSLPNRSSMNRLHINTHSLLHFLNPNW